MENNEMYKVLFDTVSALIEMPEADKLLCRQYFESVFFTKNTIVESAGKVPRHQYFIVSGIMRNYYVDESGKEVTTDMNNGPRFFTSYKHFANRTISNESIECITDCSLLRITRDDEEVLYSKSIFLSKYTILLFQQIIEKEKDRINELSTLNAKERYLKFIADNPNVLKNVPLQYIASYLGIKPETVSRIRRDVIS